MPDLVLVRHGESQWNLEGRFTGWTDVDLTAEGLEQARLAGQALAEAGLGFDLAITSMLKRTIKSQWIICEAMDLMWVPVLPDWRLNERHYGALTGLNKAETAAQYGEEQVTSWRRSYAARPPEMEGQDPRAPWRDPRYAHVAPELLPLAESLEDTLVRVRHLWDDVISPALLAGKRVILNGHGNSLGALIKMLEHLSDEDVMSLNVPNAVPLIYHLDLRLNVLERASLELPHSHVANIL